MKQQQQLVFGDAPSDLINKQQTKRRKAEHEPSLEHTSSLPSQDEVTVMDSSKQSKDKTHHVPFFSKFKKSQGKSGKETKEDPGRLGFEQNLKKATCVAKSKEYK